MPTNTNANTNPPGVVRPTGLDDDAGARPESFAPYLERGYEKRGPYTVHKIRETPGKKQHVNLVECPACGQAFGWLEQPGAHLHKRHSPEDFDF